MTDKYQPKRSEILNKVWNGIKSKYSNIKKPLKDFVGMTTVSGGMTVAVPYIIPTAMRNMKNAKNNENSKVSLAEKIGICTGVIGGVVTEFAELVGYNYAISKDHLEFLLIPIVTNLASGFYEIGRKHHSNAKEQSTENYNSESLEKTLETTKLTQK